MATTTGQVFAGKESIGAFTNTGTNTYQLALSTITLGGLQYITDVAKTLDLSVSGVGGIDVGVLAKDSIYNVFAVLSGTDVALVASLGSSPTGFVTFVDLDIQIETDYKLYNEIISELDTTKELNNLVSNSAMDYWQRGTGGVASGAYYADRFRTSVNGGYSFQVLQDTDVPTELAGDIPYSLKITATGTFSPAAVNVFGLNHGIEAQFVDLKGKKAVVSFYVKANHSATYSMSTNIWGSTEYVEIYNFDVDTSWKRVSYILDIPAEGEVTWPTGTNPGMAILMELSPGSATITAPGRYVTPGGATVRRGTTTQDNFFDTNGNEILVTGYMLHEYRGKIEPFQRAEKNLDQEFRRCLRYYEEMTVSAGTSYNNTGVVSGGGLYTVEKRVQPSLIYPVEFRFGNVGPFTRSANFNLSGGVHSCIPYYYLTVNELPYGAGTAHVLNFNVSADF